MKHTDPHHYIEKWSDLTPNDDKEVEKENVKKSEAIPQKYTRKKKECTKSPSTFLKKQSWHSSQSS